MNQCLFPSKKTNGKLTSAPTENTSQFITRAITKISVTSPVVINMPTRELLAGEMNYFV